MRKQRIVVLSLHRTEGQSISNQLEGLFGDIFDIECQSMEARINSFIFADLVLATTYLLTNDTVENLSPGTKLYVLRRTLTRAGFEKVMRIPRGKRVLLCGPKDEAQITASTLCELGARHVQYVFDEKEAPADYAIVTNQNTPVSSEIAHVLDIGDRILDPYALFDILAKLGQLNMTGIQRIINHMGSIMPRSDGFLSMIGNLEEDKRYTEQLFNVVQEGIIICNPAGAIIRFNKWGEVLLGCTASSLIGRSLDGLFSLPDQERIISETLIQDEMFLINGKRCIVNKFAINERDNTIGSVVVFRESGDIQRLEMKIRQNNVKKGHIAKYTFENIIGVSTKIKECVRLAKRMANSNSSMLIMGESGTGKELFAQAIHNDSPRREKPFVAFNCAAVSDTLIESELFGYDDGAFTGARRGGRAGLFETAHTGTLFLDEIGDISRNMQAGLLRVLQEKEIIRVGGTNIIPIDVRVIAATNRDLQQLVNEGKFRIDLYYRLNVMGVVLPSLRERRDDIPFLVEHLLKKRGVRKDVPRDVMEILRQYNWPGNVRELENCVEYMLNISDDVFRPDCLPHQIFAFGMGAGRTASVSEEKDVVELAILRTLEEAKRRMQGGMGRLALLKALQSSGISCNEGMIKTRLHHLSNRGLVSIALGRSGTAITPEGEMHLAAQADD